MAQDSEMMPVMRPRPLVVASLCAVPFALAGCAQSLDTDKLETVIKDGLTERLAALSLTVQSVDCPDRVPMQKGKSFECKASFQGGGVLPVQVDQKDDAGNVVYKLKQKIVAASKVEKSIADMLAAKSQIKAAVNCGSRVHPSIPKTTFQCVATDTKGDVAVFDVTITDDQGHVSWKLVQEQE
jgi:hypothetical protein